MWIDSDFKLEEILNLKSLQHLQNAVSLQAHSWHHLFRFVTND